MAEKIVSPGVFTRENDLSFLAQGVSNIGAAIVGPFKQGPAFKPTIVTSQSELADIFGVADGDYYTPLAAQNYLREAGSVTICRVAGLGGYTEPGPLVITAASASVSKSVAILFNTDVAHSLTATSTSILETNSGDFYINVSGSGFSGFAGSSSVDPSDVNNISKVLGTSPFGEQGAYAYAFFENTAVTFDVNTAVTASVLGAQDFTYDATYASTPWIKSQAIAGERFDLFRVHTISDGTAENQRFKITISQIKKAGSIAGSDYGSFSLQIRKYNDTDKKRFILEQFNNLTLDPNSPNYIARVIGDIYNTIDSEGLTGKITENGVWQNKSKYIRIEVKDAGLYPVAAVPFAHSPYVLPVSGTAAQEVLIPAATFYTTSGSSEYVLGLNVENNTDNEIYLKALPANAGTGSNAIFSLDTTCNVELTASFGAAVAKREFNIFFQGGFDGFNVTKRIAKSDSLGSLRDEWTDGTNMQGMDCATSNASGSVAYSLCFNALSNKDEYDINLLVTPGITRQYHPNVVTSGLDMIEAREDAFYVFDATDHLAGIDTAVAQANAVDSNYAGTYFPWVRTIDTNTNKLITIPPSVLIPAVYAANDNTKAEWFAPAGLNRGGLVGAVSVVNRLTHAERDTLYENNVNPIAQFPGQGIVVFGQKTLQQLPSALDRINVRRLLITLKKFIASSSRFLVFEQNTAETRARFLNIVNPYMESIQQRQGLYSFKVVMDESNNTPDAIDRNILQGAIYLQPTKTAEFIIIDFNVLPTGATFNA